MHDYICPPLERILQRRRREGRVDYQVATGSMDLVSVVFDVAVPTVSCNHRQDAYEETYRDSPVGFSGVSSQQRSPG